MTTPHSQRQAMPRTGVNRRPEKEMRYGPRLC